MIVPMKLLPLLTIFLAACTLQQPPTLERHSCPDIGFPYSGGWLGGDAAYSIPLAHGRSLWLFGDSFVGSPENKDRVGSTFINNSIAISHCDPREGWTVDYDWTPERGKTPASAFLKAEEPGRFWWLFDGFLHQNELYLGLLVVEKGEPRGPLNLPFHYHGLRLARISNPSAAPADWAITVLPLSDNTTALPASSMVVANGYLYLFTFLDLDATRFPRMLARLPLAALKARPDALGKELTYLARDGLWKPGLDAEDAKILMEDNATEMSVRFHPEIDRWVAVYGYPDVSPEFPSVPPSDAIYARTAENLEGPWSAPRRIYSIPELAPSLRRNEKTICYAAKEHPQLAEPGQLLLTYVCNLFTPSRAEGLTVLQELKLDMDLYRPVVVSLPLERVLGP